MYQNNIRINFIYLIILKKLNKDISKENIISNFINILNNINIFIFLWLLYLTKLYKCYKLKHVYYSNKVVEGSAY